MDSLADRIRARVRGLSCMFVGGTDTTIVEMAGWAGFDFLVLDGEHGTVWNALPNLLLAAASVEVPALVRVLARRPDMISQALDFGANGVLVPGISTIEEAQQAIRAARFAPDGDRGVAFSTRAAQYRRLGGPDYLKTANQQNVVLLQVETLGALQHLDEMLALPGYDGIFVGPTDLSVALGEESRLTERVEQEIQRIVQRAEEAKKPWGLFVGTPERFRRWREAGAYYCSTATPGVISQAFEEWLKASR